MTSSSAPTRASPSERIFSAIDGRRAALEDSEAIGSCVIGVLGSVTMGGSEIVWLSR